ncbi:hypothetical protein DAI22_12g221650 [Oryza sativa Japonica Group]|nr:hypothetical protein DAI22_12g221650 [Oryza sativa Japonica Group]
MSPPAAAAAAAGDPTPFPPIGSVPSPSSPPFLCYLHRFCHLSLVRIPSSDTTDCSAQDLVTDRKNSNPCLSS